MADDGDIAAALADAERASGVARVKSAVQAMSRSVGRLVGEVVYCNTCGQPIPTVRLLAVPGAVLCLDCQTAFEESMRGHYG